VTSAPASGSGRLAIAGLRSSGDTLEVDARFSPQAAGSYTLKQSAAVELTRPLPQTIVVRENASVVCTLKRAAGAWREVGR